MKVFNESLNIKLSYSEKVSLSIGFLKIDKILLLELIFFLFLVFGKVYVRCLYIDEERKINSIKYQIKLKQGEIGKLKTEIDKCLDREKLDTLAKVFKKEDEIEVYVVR